MTAAASRAGAAAGTAERTVEESGARADAALFVIVLIGPSVEDDDGCVSGVGAAAAAGAVVAHMVCLG